MIRASLLLSLIAVPAAATPLWDRLTTQCLRPMMMLAPPAVTGPATTLPDWWDGRADARAFDLGLGATLVISRGRQTVCAVGAANPAQAATARAAMAAWAAAPGQDTPFIGIAPQIFESFEWREPRLRVGFRESPTGVGSVV